MPSIDPREIGEAYVKSLADPLVRYMSEPPHDPLTVLAIATRGALFEALEYLEMSERSVAKESKDRPLHHSMYDHGQIYVARKVIRRVAEVLQLLTPGPLATPGERVRAARGPKYLTRADLAYAAGVHRSHVSRVERGERTLTPEMAARLAAVLDVTPEYLLTGKNPGDAP